MNQHDLTRPDRTAASTGSGGGVRAGAHNGGVSKSRTRSRPATRPQLCPCGLGAPYAQCCGRFHHDAERAAPTAELLMRSRFSAFAVRDAAYLMRTWHVSVRPPRLDLDPAQVWTRLEILGATGGGPLHAEGTVEFRAHYTDRTGSGLLHENSRFTRADGRWMYAGTVPHRPSGFAP